MNPCVPTSQKPTVLDARPDRLSQLPPQPSSMTPWSFLRCVCSAPLLSAHASCKTPDELPSRQRQALPLNTDTVHLLNDPSWTQTLQGPEAHRGRGPGRNQSQAPGALIPHLLRLLKGEALPICLLQYFSWEFLQGRRGNLRINSLFV